MKVMIIIFKDQLDQHFINRMMFHTFIPVVIKGRIKQHHCLKTIQNIILLYCRTKLDNELERTS